MSAVQVPAPPAPVARPPRWGRRGGRRARATVPYVLLLPAATLLLLVLAYPLMTLGRLSLQKYGLAELFSGEGSWIGLDNYTKLLSDSFFWTVVLRSVVFTVIAVGLTMSIGMGVALLMTALGRSMRLLVTIGLISAWAMPVVVAVTVWQWLVDPRFGVVNWLLAKLGFSSYAHHNWFENPVEGFAVIIALVVWGAVPFVAITLYAGLTQVPKELEDAARVDGANGWQAYRYVTLPVIRPIIVILTSLSIIWDFQVFNQVWLMNNSKPTRDYYVVSIYSYVQSFAVSDYGSGAAIAVVTVLILLVVTFYYIRQMLRIGELS